MFQTAWVSFTLMFVQLANFIWAICVDGVNEFVLAYNGEVVDTARFSFNGVLLNEKARDTWNRIGTKLVGELY